MIYPTHYLICFFSLSILTLNYLSTCLFIHISYLFFIFIFFFFFQAEDGIRDLYVTGVQTCALPIYLVSPPTCMKARSWVNPDSRIFGHPRSASSSEGTLARNSGWSLDRAYGAQIGRASCRERV